MLQNGSSRICRLVLWGFRQLAQPRALVESAEQFAAAAHVLRFMAIDNRAAQGPPLPQPLELQSDSASRDLICTARITKTRVLASLRPLAHHLLLRQCPASLELRADRAAPGTTREHEVEDEEHVEVPEVTPCSPPCFALPALGADASPRLGRAAVKEAGVYLGGTFFSGDIT